MKYPVYVQQILIFGAGRRITMTMTRETKELTTVDARRKLTKLTEELEDKPALVRQRWLPCMFYGKGI